MDLDAKVTEDVDRYLGGEGTLSPHGFLGKDPYNSLSIDIDLATEKKVGLNLTGYDSILQDELPSEKLLEEPCEKVDDEYILSDFQLYHLDPLTLSPDDMTVAGDILPSTSGQPTLNVVENHDRETAETRVRAVSRTGWRSGDEVSCGKAVRVAVRYEPRINSNVRDKEENKNEKADEAVEAIVVGNSSEFFVGISEANLSNAEAKAEKQGVPQIPGATMERSKVKTRVKLEPRIIKKRRKMSERSDKRLDNRRINNGTSLIRNDSSGGTRQDDTMAVVAISTDKTSNTTQIVINTGTERQVYQGKTSELIEATGNIPMLSKIDTSIAVWNDTLVAERNGFDSSNPSSGQYEIVISKALEELGITDDSLQPVCVTEHDKVWLCPRDDCNRQFGRLYTLKGHLLAHYGVRPFKVRPRVSHNFPLAMRHSCDS